MSVDLATLRQHLDYSAWASARLVSAASPLSDAERERDFGTADKSVLGTLVHVFAADRVWLARVRGETPGRFIDAERDMKWTVVEEEWPRLLASWQEFLANTGPEAIVSYRDLKGNAFTNPLWEIVLHVVNHGSHHRGQVSGFLRAMGHRPPPLDLIAYYRELAAASKPNA